MLAQVVEGVNGPDHENKAFLPGFKCPESLKATSDMAAAIEGAEIILMVIPTPFVGATLGQLLPRTPDPAGCQCHLKLKMQPATHTM